MSLVWFMMAALKVLLLVVSGCPLMLLWMPAVLRASGQRLLSVLWCCGFWGFRVGASMGFLVGLLFFFYCCYSLWTFPLCRVELQINKIGFESLVYYLLSQVCLVTLLFKLFSAILFRQLYFYLSLLIN